MLLRTLLAISVGLLSAGCSASSYTVCVSRNVAEAGLLPEVHAGIALWTDTGKVPAVEYSCEGRPDLRIMLGETETRLTEQGTARWIPGITKIKSGQITTIVLNSAQEWTSYWATRVTAHEFGHFLGLDHTTDRTSIMCEYGIFTDEIRLMPEDLEQLR